MKLKRSADPFEESEGRQRGGLEMFESRAMPLRMVYVEGACVIGASAEVKVRLGLVWRMSGLGKWWEDVGVAGGCNWG